MSTKQQEITKKQILLNNFIDKLMEINYQAKSKTQGSLQTKQPAINPQINYMELFDLLIWTEKKKPQLLQNLLQMDVLSTAISSIGPQKMCVDIKAFILLINNCKPNGEIITRLLADRLVDEIIFKYLESLTNTNTKNKEVLEEQLEYLGSLLKACNNHINEKTYGYFLNPKRHSSKQSQSNNKKFAVESKPFDSSDIMNSYDEKLQREDKKQINQKQQQKKQNQCLLVKVCTRFYNCPQELTKTTVLNILMSIMRQPFANQLMMNPITKQPYNYIYEWSYNLCSQFRNELKNLNQQLMVLQPQEHQFYIQEINDKIILWEDLTQETQCKQIFALNFMQLVIHSLIVGSLNTSSQPMFNIKFTFFILAKIMKICANLGLVCEVGRLLFLKSDLEYCENWITTAFLKGFDIKKILHDDYFKIENKQKIQMNKFSGVNEFFINMLKSKDEHFLLISSNMLQQLIFHVKKDEKLTHQFSQTLGFTPNGSNLVKITSILIVQLKFDHSLKNLKKICQTLIFLHPQKCFSDQNLNEFVYFYSDFLNQTLELIEKGKKYWPYIVETFQYDMKILDYMQFQAKPYGDKQLLIHPSERAEYISMQIKELNGSQQNDNNKSFYNFIPQTPSEILRYKIIKSFLLLKLKEIMIESKQRCQILSKYVEKLKIWQQKQTKPGDKIPYPLKQKFHQCKVVEQKTQIPCVRIEDDVNLLLGFIESDHVKIIVNVKLKHVETDLYTRKQKTYIKLKFSKFDFNFQNIVPKSILLLRGFTIGSQYFSVKKQNFKEKELNSIRKGLKKTLENLPQISLL